MNWIQEGAAATISFQIVGTDGVPLPSLSIPQGMVFLSKNGAAMATISSGTGGIPDKHGYFFFHLAAGDLNTRGRLKVAVPSVSGGISAWENFMVVPTLKWAFLFGDGAVPTVGVTGTVNYLVGGYIGSVGMVGTVNRVLSVGSVAAGAVGTVPHATSVGTALHSQTVGTALFVRDGIIGSVGFVSGGIIGSVGHVASGYEQTIGTVSRVLSVGSIDIGIIGTIGHAVSVGTALHAQIVGTALFVRGGIIGSVANVEPIGTVTHVVHVGSINGGIIGTVTWLVGGIVGSVGHTASGYSMTVGTVDRVLSVGSIDAGVIGTISHAMTVGTVDHVKEVASVAFVSDGLIGTISRVLSVGSVDAGAVGTVGYSREIGTITGGWASAPANQLADFVLLRSASNTEGAADKQSLTGAILKLTGKVADDGSGNLDTYMTNGVTKFMSQAITTDSSLAAISALAKGA